MNLKNSDINTTVKVRETEILATDTRQQYREKIARITLDAMVQFVGLLDAKGTVLEINHVALNAVGIDLSEVEGKPFWNSFWWQVSEEINGTLRSSIASAAEGEFVRWDTPIYGRAGGKETIIIDASLAPVKDENGTVVFICAEGRDITEKKAQEREIAQKNAELQGLLERIRELDEIKTQFFANVSHELRTPLALIIGPAERLLKVDNQVNAETQRETAQVIVRNARMLLKHVNDLLDISKLEAGKLKIDLKETNVAEVIRFVASHFQVLASERDVLFSVDAAPVLTAAIDPEKLQRIVMNLLSNAFKFVPNGGAVRCRLEVIGQELVISVEDSGPGVKPEMRRMIFERFRQGDGATNRQYAGTGLGLAIAHEFIEMHKGTIEVFESDLGGASFKVTLPIKHVSTIVDRSADNQDLNHSTLAGLLEELRTPLPAQKPKNSVSSHSLGRDTILVVEDNPEMNSFIVQSLDDEYDVISAFDGQQGIEKALAYRPTLIVSDIMMPNISGEQMINELRKDPQMDEMPILLLSAKADDELKNKLLAKQAQDYITKPFSERELQVRIRNLVAVRRSREALREAEKGKHVEMELANRDLQIRLKQLSELFEQTPSFMVVLRGPKHILEFANSAFYNLVGNRELIGSSVLEAFPEVEGQGFFELLDQVLASGQPFQGKELPVLLQRKQGMQLEQRYIDFVFQPLIENNLIAGIFIEGHDVTEQVNAKRQLQENEERLEQLVNERTGALKHLNQSLKLSNEDLQQFAHVASHDLKEPIRKIKTYSKRLQDDYKQLLPEQGNNFLNKILSATDRIYSMIDGVLSYSKMTSDEHPEEIVDLNKVLKHIETDLEVLIEEKKATIEVARLPQVKGASILFYQLFYNLVNNSIKFSKANEPPRITIKSSKVEHEGNPFVRIVVKDNGIGFDPENSEKIFKTFTRLNSKDRYEGTGLGLALCKKIVQRHGGFISAKGQKNAGAEFTVLLPLD